MSYERHQIAALIEVDPKKAADRILKAFKKSGMHRGNAAAVLGCSHGTLLRWIQKLDLDPKLKILEKQAEKEGWIASRYGGRHQGSKDRTPRTRRWGKKPAEGHINPG